MLPAVGCRHPGSLGGKEIAEFEYRVITGNGFRVRVATGAAPIMDGEGKVIGAAAVWLHRKE